MAVSTKYSSTEAAAKLGISDALARRYCRQGRLGTKVGRNYVISDAQLEAFRSLERNVGRPSLEQPEPPPPKAKPKAEPKPKRKRKAAK